LNPDRGRGFFTSPKHLYWLKGPGCNGYHEFLPQWKSGWAVRPTTHLLVVPGLRMGRVIPPLPLYAFMACAGATVPF